MKHLDINITGNVQGVFFRASAKEKADEFGLAGAAWNAPDGSVMIEVEGDEASLEDFVNWCKEGPSGARVDRVIAEAEDVKGLEGFEIKL